MKIELENLGFLKQGSFSVKPLTIFCGANNTGKTYALYVLYGLLSQLRSSFPLPIPDTGELAKKLIDEGSCDVDVDELYKKYAEEVANHAAATMTRRLDRFFSTSQRDFSESSIKISLMDDYVKAIDSMKAVVFNRRRTIKLNTSDIDAPAPTLRVAKVADSSMLRFTASGELPHDIVLRFVRRYVMQLFFSPQGGNIFLLPAERGGINIFQKELVSKRTAYFHSGLKTQDESNEVERHIARYPVPIADYIDFLNDVDLWQGDDSKLAPLAEELEREVLGGTYSIDDGHITFISQGSPTPINLHLSSSTVKTYFGLWFYLKHVATEGGCLMIDEPELSLHPDNQRKVARILTKVVNSGVQVILSTHSDYIIKEINNEIMLDGHFEERSQLMDRFGYSEKNVINKDEIAAFTFHNGGISEMEIDSNEGIIATTFDEVINTLNASSNEIYFSRKSGQNSLTSNEGYSKDEHVKSGD